MIYYDKISRLELSKSAIKARLKDKMDCSIMIAMPLDEFKKKWVSLKELLDFEKWLDDKKHIPDSKLSKDSYFDLIREIEDRFFGKEKVKK